MASDVQRRLSFHCSFQGHRIISFSDTFQLTLSMDVRGLTDSVPLIKPYFSTPWQHVEDAPVGNVSRYYLCYQVQACVVSPLRVNVVERR